MLNVELFKVGAYRTNCFIIQDNKTQETAIIDPGATSVKLLERLEQIGKHKIKYIILTHGHFDHIGKAEFLRDITNAKILISKKDSEFTSNPNLNLSISYPKRLIKPFVADLLLEEGQIINLGENKIKFLETPGHTRGSMICLSEDYMFSGDTIFKNARGRTDLATGNEEQILKSLNRIKQLSKNYKIYPGHGEITELDIEKTNI